MTDDGPELLPCDRCDADVPRDATRCPDCGAVVVTLDRAMIVVAIGLLLIPAGLWGVYQLRTAGFPSSTASLLAHLGLIVAPILLLYAGAQLYRHRKRKLDEALSRDGA